MIASWILAYGFFLEGRYAQAFPTFGAERRGAPVEAFVRMDDVFPNLRCKVTRPDYVIVMGGKLVSAVDVAGGIRKGAFMLINSAEKPEAFEFLRGDFVLKCMDVSTIALNNGLGSRTSPFINTPILGALAGFTDLLKPESVIGGIERFISTGTESNIAAFKEAYRKAKAGFDGDKTQ